MRLSMGYPDRESERTILRSHGMRRTDVEQVLTLEEVHELIEAAEAVKVHEDLENYILGARGEDARRRAVAARRVDAWRGRALPRVPRARARARALVRHSRGRARSRSARAGAPCHGGDRRR
jgi:MoxR-like ATPase